MAYTMTQLTEFFTNANAGTGPTAAQQLALQGLLSDNQGGVSNDATFAKVVNLASDNTLAVSVGTYNFFMGYAPSQAGLAALNAAYVGSGAQASLNGENRFIAQSVSLALQNATAKASFSATYGTLSVEAATKAAYLIIIGQAAADAKNINVDASVAYLASASAQAYYKAFIQANIPGIAAADLDLAVKAAIIGEILFQATKYDNGAGLGNYAVASNNLISDLALDNVLTNDNVSGINLLEKYGQTGNNGSSLVLTTGVDTLTGTTGDDTFTGTFVATTGTFTALDSIAGGAGNDTLAINAIDALTQAAIDGVTVTGVETVNVRGALDVNADVSNWTGVTALNVTQGVNVTVGASSSAAIGVSGATGDVIVDGGKSVTVNDAAAGNNITVGNTTATSGAVSVTDTNLTNGAITIDGGSTVTVSASKNSGGTIDIGAATAATGAVTVTNTGVAYSAAGNNTMGAVNTTGGSTVVVTQVAASSVAGASTDTSAQTHTQGAIGITGDASTVEVAVKQDATVAAVNAQTADGTKEIQSVTFVAMAATETVTINGLVFTANKALTAAEVASAFAGLANGATVGSAPVSSGTYSGTFGTVAGTTGAVSGNTVNFTVTAYGPTGAITVGDTAAAGNVAATVTTAGVAQTITSTKAGSAGVVAGAVTINGAITGADKLAKVSLDGYGTTTIASDALATLNLAHSDSNVSVTNGTATVLALGLNTVGLNDTATIPTLALGGTYTTVNVATSAASTAVLTGAGVTALNVSGAGALDLSTTSLAALKTVTVSGAGGLSLVATGGAVTSVDASASSGKNTISINAANATYTGGTGADSVTLSTTTVSKAVSLGAGDDTLTLATGTTSLGAMVSGGDGTDTLKMAAADAVTASAGTTFETKFTGFERLSLGAIGATGAIDLANLNDISYVASAGISGAFTQTLNNFGNSGTLELNAAAATGTYAVVLTDATGTADVLNIITKLGGSANLGTVSAAGVETINLTATDTATATIDTHTVALTDAALKTLTISGNAKVALTVGATATALTVVDASAATGALTFATASTAAAGATVTGGSAADALTANHSNDVLIGGAGGDTLTVGAGANLVTLTGGAGNDTFAILNAATNVNSYATITDAAAGDILKFANTASAETFTSAKLALGDTAVFQDYANQAIATSDEGGIVWFQFAGNTYVVENISNNATTFQNGQDIIVKITGAIDLSTASFGAASQTLVLH